MMLKIGDCIMEKQENEMGTSPIERLLIRMAIPLILSMLVQSIYGLVDSIFVAKLGSDALTAISLCMSVQYIITGAGVGIGVGANAVLSKYLGKKDSVAVNQSAGNGLLIIWIFSIVFMIVGQFLVQPFFQLQTNIESVLQLSIIYGSIMVTCACFSMHQTFMERLLSATGKTHLAMVSMLIGSLVNLILDPIFIFGYFGFPVMGIAGAAWATVIAQGLATLCGFLLNIIYNQEIQWKWTSFKWNQQIVYEIVQIGIPVMISQCLVSVLAFGMNNILLPLSTVAPSIYVVWVRLQSFATLPASGISNANISIMSYNYGAKRKERVMKAFWTSIQSACVVSMVAMGIFFIFPRQLLYLFDASEAMYEIGIPAFRIIALGLILICVTSVFTGFLQALGRGKEVLFISIMQAVLLVGGGYVLSLTNNLTLVWFAFPIMEVCRFCIALFFVRCGYKKQVAVL